MKLSAMNHKILPSTSLFILALLCSPLLLAHECEVSLSSSHIEYGLQQHPSGAVAQDGKHNLDRREIRLHASCADDAAIELSLRGPVQGDQLKFSSQGQVSLRMNQAQLDGRTVALAKLGDLGTGTDSIAVAPGDIIVPVEAGRHARGKNLVLSLEIIPQLPLSDMRSRDAKVHEGQLRIEASGT